MKENEGTEGCENTTANELHNHHEHHHHPQVVLVKVTYVGKTDWVEDVVGDTPLLLVKENAMRFFGLEVAKHECYALQYDGTDQSEKKDVRCFESKEVTLTLVLKENPNKG